LNATTILLVGNFLSRRGLTRQVCEELALRLEERGWTVIQSSGRLNRRSRLADMLWTVWHRRRDYEVAAVDVFSGPSFAWTEAVAWLLKQLDKPFVLMLHGGGLPEFAHRHPARVKRVLGWADAVTSPSRFLSEGLMGFNSGIEVIPNAIELPKYPFRLRDHPGPKLVWLRAFHNIYGPTLAPRVLRRVQEVFPDAKLIMAGPDKDGSLAEVKAVAAVEGVFELIEFTGKVHKEAVPAVLNRADIFINTTTVDNLPTSVLEALACGLCVVSTNVGGIPFLVEHGKDGFLVPQGDPDAMAATVIRILREPGLAGKLSTNGRRKAEQFDWETVLPMWEALFESLADIGHGHERTFG